jgi:hypothetical protein
MDQLETHAGWFGIIARDCSAIVFEAGEPRQLEFFEGEPLFESLELQLLYERQSLHRWDWDNGRSLNVSQIRYLHAKWCNRIATYSGRGWSWDRSTIRFEEVTVGSLDLSHIELSRAVLQSDFNLGIRS